MITRFIAALACLALCSAAGIAQQKDRSPDEQVKDLILKYNALPDKDQSGPAGVGIIKQLKALPPGKLSPQSQEAIAKLESSHNLKTMGLAIRQNSQQPPVGDGKPQYLDPYAILPYIDQGPRRRWEYKVVPEVDLLKLGKDDLAAGLNKLGEESWELIGFQKTQFIFKRPR